MNTVDTEDLLASLARNGIKYDFLWWCFHCRTYHPGVKGGNMKCPNSKESGEFMPGLIYELEQILSEKIDRFTKMAWDNQWKVDEILYDGVAGELRVLRDELKRLEKKYAK